MRGEETISVHITGDAGTPPRKGWRSRKPNGPGIEAYRLIAEANCPKYFSRKASESSSRLKKDSENKSLARHSSRRRHERDAKLPRPDLMVASTSSRPRQKAPSASWGLSFASHFRVLPTSLPIFAICSISVIADHLSKSIVQFSIGYLQMNLLTIPIIFSLISQLST